MDAGQLLFGRVMHQRLRPIGRRFTYRVVQLRLDLARLGELDGALFGIDRARPLSLRRRDYGPRDGSELLPWIRGQLQAAGMPADGAVWLQTFPRVFGMIFNPVSFWYCHDAAGALRAVLAEVNNTFGENHCYLLARPDGGPIAAADRLHCRKTLHVSPFCRTEGRYEFRLQAAGAASSVAIDYFDAQGLLLRTAIGGRLQPLARAGLLRALLRYPTLPLTVLGGIHWQALRLWLGRVRWVPKPAPPPQRLTLADREESET
jgi:DUF1365 family protein